MESYNYTNLRLPPPSWQGCARPSGNDFTKSLRWAWPNASQMASSVLSSSGSKLKRRSPEKSVGSWRGKWGYINDLMKDWGASSGLDFLWDFMTRFLLSAPRLLWPSILTYQAMCRQSDHKFYKMIMSWRFHGIKRYSVLNSVFS